MRIYLAGGMRAGWRDRVSSAAPGHTYLSPTTHGLADPRLYKAWDLAAIRSSDVFFGYFAADNPSGFGLAVELGYAHALGKLTIYADEKTTAAPEIARYLAFLRVTADTTFDTLAEAVAFLGTLPS